MAIDFEKFLVDLSGDVREIKTTQKAEAEQTHGRLDELRRLVEQFDETCNKRRAECSAALGARIGKVEENQSTAGANIVRAKIALALAAGLAIGFGALHINQIRALLGIL